MQSTAREKNAAAVLSSHLGPLRVQKASLSVPASDADDASIFARGRETEGIETEKADSMRKRPNPGTLVPGRAALAPEITESRPELLCEVLLSASRGNRKHPK